MLPDLATIAALIGDPTRASILWALLGGEALPAGELASRAQVTNQTASAHLAKLVQSGLLEVEPIQRHRYYKLKNAEVAQLLESLAIVAPPLRLHKEKDTVAHQSIRAARTCYDHLAGQLGVAITQALLSQELLTLEGEHYQLTPAGQARLAKWQINDGQLRQSRRKFAYPCLDWSERTPHLAGSLGAAIADKCFAMGWLKRLPNTRAIQLTSLGSRELRQALGLDFPYDAASNW